MRVDLHTHTNASDGTDPPAKLVAAAVAAGLDVLGITDHDTTRGWAQALDARPSGLTIVPGAEFSCVHYDPTGRRVSLHLLGYLFDPHDPALRAERSRLRKSRLVRAEEIVQRLVADDVGITWDQVGALADGATVGRPHIARALVAAGAVPDVSTAFAELLSSRGRYYVRKADTDVFRCDPTDHRGRRPAGVRAPHSPAQGACRRRRRRRGDGLGWAGRARGEPP